VFICWLSSLKWNEQHLVPSHHTQLLSSSSSHGRKQIHFSVCSHRADYNVNWSGHGDSESQSSTNSPPSGWQPGKEQHEVWKPPPPLLRWKWKCREATNIAASHKRSFSKQAPTSANVRIVQVKQRLLHPAPLKLADSSPSVQMVKPYLNTPCSSQAFFLGTEGRRGKSEGSVCAFQGGTDRYRKFYIKILEGRCRLLQLPSIPFFVRLTFLYTLHQGYTTLALFSLLAPLFCAIQTQQRLGR